MTPHMEGFKTCCLVFRSYGKAVLGRVAHRHSVVDTMMPLCYGVPTLRCFREKDELANAKLQQMVSGQNEAERRKGDAETLSTDLEKQNNRIAQRRHQVCCITFQL